MNLEAEGERKRKKIVRVRGSRIEIEWIARATGFAWWGDRHIRLGWIRGQCFFSRTKCSSILTTVVDSPPTRYMNPK